MPALVGSVALLAAGIAKAFATAEKPDLEPPLVGAEQLVENADYPEAIDLLNSRIYPYLNTDVITRGQSIRFHTLMGRALYGGQRELDTPHPDNDRNSISQFVRAEELDADLATEDLARLARSYIALGAPEEAGRRIDEIPDGAHEIRDRLRQELVSYHLDQVVPETDEALDQIAHLLSDPIVDPPIRVWALEQQARIRIALGFVDDAVTQLLREMPPLVGRSGVDLSGLRLALGRAYLELGALEEAEGELALVDNDQGGAQEGTEERAEAMLLRGHVDMRRSGEDRLPVARDRYQEVVDRYSGADVHAEALLGLAEAEAALDDHAASAQAYEQLVTRLKSVDAPRDPTREEVSASLLDRYERATEREEWLDALRYATIAGDIWPIRDTPPDVLIALAHAHEAAASRLLGETGGIVEKVVTDDLDPATRLELKRHLLRAAGYYNAHAEHYVVDDIDRHRDSLWAAARLFDRAGDKSQAIRVYSAFAQVSREDPRYAEARFLLAQAQQSRGEYEAAAAIYNELIEERRSSSVSRVGPWADASLVPLAQCYMADGRPENDADAEAALLEAVDGVAGGPTRPSYMEALLSLGQLYYERGRYDLALERLMELRDRREQSGDDKDPAVSYRIADASRQLAGQIDDRLEGELRDDDRRAMASEREKRLREALTGFIEVRDALGKVSPSRVSPLEAMFLRNAMFYMGDCAYDLGEMEVAIAHYTAARRRYAQEPASLVALMQIVNAHVARGDLASARAANERAKDFLASLPDDVWNDPTLPIGRADWQRWLDANTELYRQGGAGG
ncbi:MAG: hypothetical protein CMJ31_09500, partial [Phycisphaerae bacterium]|nr:hypothetical protein [Phycisphaerae bacterium]